jgi:hypothetical protein
MIINITKKLFLDLSTEWSQLGGDFNWYAFTFIELYFENDKWTGGYEFVATFLGFRLRARYNTDEGLKKMKEWEEEVVNAKELINTPQK